MCSFFFFFFFLIRFFFITSWKRHAVKWWPIRPTRQLISLYFLVNSSNERSRKKKKKKKKENLFVSIFTNTILRFLTKKVYNIFLYITKNKKRRKTTVPYVFHSWNKLKRREEEKRKKKKKKERTRLLKQEKTEHAYLMCI